MLSLACWEYLYEKLPGCQSWRRPLPRHLASPFTDICLSVSMSDDFYWVSGNDVNDTKFITQVLFGRD